MTLSPQATLRRILQAFSQRGWRQGQDVASDIVERVQTAHGKPDVAKLTSSVPGLFLSINKIKRAHLREALQRAVGDIEVVTTGSGPSVLVLGDYVAKSTVQVNNSGVFAGTVASPSSRVTVRRQTMRRADASLVAPANRRPKNVEAPNDHRRFMELAIEVSRKSMAEDDRIHPIVGAVVVKEGRIVAQAHRGEVPGSHAEYIALERMAGKHVLAGATVYTTLEPCTDRKHPKVPCSDRLIERRVARVVIGMLDPNEAIRGKGLLRLREAGIAIEMFPSDLMAAVEDLNREFIRIHRADRSARSPSG